MKLDYPKEWFAYSAEIEGDSEIGAGAPPSYWAGKGKREEEFDWDTRIAFGLFVELWRRDKGWSAAELAREAGIEEDEVLKIELEAIGEPEPGAVCKLAEVMGVSARKMLELAGLVAGRTARVREKEARYGVESEAREELTGEELTGEERRKLEAFVSVLGSE